MGRICQRICLSLAEKFVMPQHIILEEDCVLVKINQDILANSQKFECGNADLDEFFNEEAIRYDIELLGRRNK